ncbi:hypothetical protein AB0K15_47135 [Amycolatopsis sp. NPDC049253]|uniref:hypothetical protein n=1 Tax=Amycolatopsis sp. NPDC049253 TaxID=3155274 RepID=UPI0034476539
MAKQQHMFPGIKTGSGVGKKLLGLVLLALVVGCVVTSPLETATFVKHVITNLSTFFRSL